VFVGRVGDETPEQFFSQLIAIGAIHTLRTKAQKAASKADKKTGSNKAIDDKLAGGNKSIDTERRGFDSTFQLHLSTGNVEVDPKDATWSSEHRNSARRGPCSCRSTRPSRSPDADQSRWQLTLKSSGPDSLVIYGVPGDKILRMRCAASSRCTS